LRLVVFCLYPGIRGSVFSYFMKTSEIDTDLLFKRVSAEHISRGLEELFASIDKKDCDISRSTNSNFLILTSASEDKEVIEDLLSTFSMTHPGRFFIISGDSQKEGIESEVSLRCQTLSRSSYICSEVIRISSSVASLSAVPSIVRAHMMSGVPTEVFLRRPEVNIELFQQFISFCDLLIIDSEEFENDFLMMERLTRLDVPVLDLQWIGLSAWREQIKSIFERPFLEGCLSGISRIAAAGNSSLNPGYPAAVLLMAGWLIGSLRLEVESYGESGYECVSTTGNIVQLRLDSQIKKGSLSSLLALEMFFSGKVSGRHDLKILLERKEVLDTTIEFQDVHKLSRPLDEESLTARIKKYFLIGESTTNYQSALQNALELHRLYKAFIR